MKEMAERLLGKFLQEKGIDEATFYKDPQVEANIANIYRDISALSGVQFMQE